MPVSLPRSRSRALAPVLSLKHFRSHSLDLALLFARALSLALALSLLLSLSANWRDLGQSIDLLVGLQYKPKNNIKGHKNNTLSCLFSSILAILGLKGYFQLFYIWLFGSYVYNNIFYKWFEPGNIMQKFLVFHIKNPFLKQFWSSKALFWVLNDAFEFWG